MVVSNEPEPVMMRSAPKSVRAQRSGGFTLVEVITAMVLVAVLGAVVIPVMMSRNRMARAEADVAEFQSLRTALMMFYSDVGRVPATLEYLYVMPASPTDICGFVIPALNAARFRGPYVSRQIFQLSPTLTSYPIASGDSVETVLTHPLVNTQKVIQIRLYGPEKDIVDAIDTKIDGTVDGNNGAITYTGGGPLLQQYTVRFNIPVRNQGC